MLECFICLVWLCTVCWVLSVHWCISGVHICIVQQLLPVRFCSVPFHSIPFWVLYLPTKSHMFRFRDINCGPSKRQYQFVSTCWPQQAASEGWRHITLKYQKIVWVHILVQFSTCKQRGPGTPSVFFKHHWKWQQYMKHHQYSYRHIYNLVF